MFNGPEDISIRIGNYWRLEQTDVLSHKSQRFGIIRTKMGGH